MIPPLLDELRVWLKASGWNLLEAIDFSQKYLQWYVDFLTKLRDKKAELLVEFTEEAFQEVEATFECLVDKINTKTWGGALLLCKKGMFASTDTQDNAVDLDLKFSPKI